MRGKRRAARGGREDPITIHRKASAATRLVAGAALAVVLPLQRAVDLIRPST